VAIIAGQSYVFGEDSRPAFWGMVQYDVAFPYPTVDTELTIAFERGADDVSALGSKVVLPALFATTPLPTTSYSRANDALDLHWAPFDEAAPVDWLLSGSCLLPVRQNGAIDSGTVHIAPGTLRKPNAQDLPPSQEGTTIPDECIAALSVTKQRGGRI